MNITYSYFIFMSTFVHPENQKIIWNIVNSNIYVNDFFQTHTNVSKEQWFRSIIEKFYIQNEGKNLSMEELNNLNKDVLTFMVKSIHSIPPPNPPQENNHPRPTAYDSPTQTTYSSQINTPPYIANNMGEQNNKEFEEKKQEYDQMNAKHVPKEVNFEEKEKDTVIENMDELINKHLNEREQQLKELAPSIISDVKPAVSMPSNDISNNITFQVKEPTQETASNTNVQDEVPLILQIAELKNAINQLQDNYNEMKNTLDEKINNHTTSLDNLTKEIETMRINANKIKHLDQESEKSDD